ncbi:hypothetical protein DTO271D3_5268 [Paecilomyces variotii]|nr:hypothetical protein DTO271D3_5268 [Paecilomyces variotii]
MGFFASHWVGSEVKFTGANPSTWTLVEKMSERDDQDDEDQYQEDPAPSSAWALFQCRENNHSNNTAIMKIYMQIPYAGSEFELPTVRRRQADGFDRFAHNEFRSLKTLTSNHCESTPSLLDYKYEKQDDFGPVPGGFILYLLMNELPGVRLTDDGFGNLERAERDKIRQSFKVAWEDCIRCGAYNFESDISNLLWDKQLERSYIVGHQMSRPSRPEDVWRDVWWLTWGLARGHPGSRSYKDVPKTSDTSKWTM